MVLKEFSGQNEIVKRIQNAITEELKVESEEAFLNWSVCVKQEKLIIGCVRIT